MIGQKSIACTLCAIAVFLLIAAAANSDWASSDGWREGLFTQCAQKGSPTPLPFNQPLYVAGSAECFPRLDENQEIEPMAGYKKTTLAFLLIGLLADFVAAFLTGMGLKSEDSTRNKKLNLMAICLLIVAMISLLVTAIVFPVYFTKDLDAAGTINYDGKITILNNTFNGTDGMKINGTDGTVDLDAEDRSVLDSDLDGIMDDVDSDVDGDGIPDEVENRAGTPRVFSYGFSYGVVCVSLIFVVISIVLLILDHFNPEPEKEEKEELEKEQEA